MVALTTFKVYRYQLLPIDRHTADLYDGVSPSEVIERKNTFFAESIPFVTRYRHRGGDLVAKVERSQNDAFILQLATNRPLTRETPEFLVEQLENWPHVTAIILNRPDEQYIAVQERPSAFASTDTVVKVVQKATRQSLERLGLRLHVESMFRENYFWDLVEQHHHKITWVEFEFITPNMANISDTLSDTLKRLSKDTNSVKGDLKLQSDPAAALDLSPSDATVQGLVDYTSQGGGDISLKVKGIRKRFHTSSSSREVELTDLEINAPPDQVAAILREALK